MKPQRFVTVAWDEAQNATNAGEYEPWDGDRDYSSYLLDTKTNKIVFNDRMEPEDATLDRDLSPLVDLLNETEA